jgi:hypothetical protein
MGCTVSTILTTKHYFSGMAVLGLLGPEDEGFVILNNIRNNSLDTALHSRNKQHKEKLKSCIQPDLLAGKLWNYQYSCAHMYIYIYIEHSYVLCTVCKSHKIPTYETECPENG